MFWQDITVFRHVWEPQYLPATYCKIYVCCGKPWKVPHSQRTQTHSANCSTVTITWRWEEIEIPSPWNRPRWQIDRGIWKAIFRHQQSIDFPPFNSSLSKWWLCEIVLFSAHADLPFCGVALHVLSTDFLSQTHSLSVSSILNKIVPSDLSLMADYIVLCNTLWVHTQVSGVNWWHYVSGPTLIFILFLQVSLVVYFEVCLRFWNVSPYTLSISGPVTCVEVINIRLHWATGHFAWRPDSSST